MAKTGRQLSQAEIVDAIHASHVKIKDWTHVHSMFEGMRDSGWIFRGVTSPNHYPLPSIGRANYYGPYKRAQEERLLTNLNCVPSRS